MIYKKINDYVKRKSDFVKQAYLIIAHNKIEQLKLLVSLLDYEQHDIYILFDKKAQINREMKGQIERVVKKSTLYFTKEIPIYWGDYSLVEAELELFTTALKNNDYSMYHLLSGVDLPLDTAENIYIFFDERKDYNFLTMVSDELFKKNKIYERVSFKYFVPHLSSRSINNKILKKGLNIYRRSEIGLQRILRIDNFKKYNMDLKYASNWCSLNHKVVQVLVKEREFIEKVFKQTIVNDELFIPTILEKKNLLKTAYSLKPTNDQPTDFQGNLRYINWWDGSPYTWTDSDKDIEQLKYGKKQGHLFSRKFDIDKYPKMKEIVLEIINLNIEGE